MNFDFATIRQSLISITDNLYSKEKFTEINQKSIDNLKEKEFQEQLKKQYQSNVQKLYDTKNKTVEKNYTLYGNNKDKDNDKYNDKDKDKDNDKDKDKDKDDKKEEIKMIDSIDMNNFNEQILREKNKNAKKNRQMINKQINDINLEKQQRKEKIKQREEREQKQKDLIKKSTWNAVKNDWYWGSYNNNLKKTSYSEVDNSLDNLKKSNYLSVPLSNEYKIIGNDETNEEEKKVQTAKPFIYQSPLKDYIYDVKNNQLVAYNISEKNEEDTKITATSSPTLPSTPIPSLSVKEGFSNDINVDPKLFEIYQKTLTTKKNTVSYDVDYTYNYVFILIIIIILFLLFKSS